LQNEFCKNSIESKEHYAFIHWQYCLHERVTGMKKIYLAGPDVFLPNAIEEGERLKALCHSHGYEGLFPMDNVITGQTPQNIAMKIQDANKKMIHACDIVIANLSPFRGPEPDSGTVWEVGYAQALGKTVFAYSHDRRNLKEKTQALLNLGVDNTGMAIEDFGLTHNLMFASCVVADHFEECLKIAVEQDKRINPLHEIIQLGNPLLRKLAHPAEDITSNETQTLIQELILTCQASNGVGIAAPQIGIAKAIIIMASYPNERYPHAPMMEPTALINPHVRAHSANKEKEWEGCLSLPGVRARVPRYEWVDVRYTTRDGVAEEKRFEGFLARIFQHEYDHLHGKVFLDNIESTHDVVMEQEYRSIIREIDTKGSLP
jgi:peptide deformylase